ncbi:protease FtsH subunit HflC [Hasllibacter halocynthiae]|uniref:Protein HflC n=1 Tax=Hasllibacter halocynthiae TaxID=595589 RepID=A0A2T0X6X3_9RHOB|nr:protease modulator HflC [Hasllibacter halocynthiae]PRY94702.1 protease FtsH subunit HflC [Hasllibacter halocynthiae]
MNRNVYLAIAGVVALVVLLSSVFIVDEREKALVLQFGQIERVEEEPGLKFKIPFIQEVVRYDDRILALETDVIEVTPSDDRRLVVDAFARYRISDPVRFRQSVGAAGLASAERQLEDILTTQTRAVLGADGVTSNTILSPERGVLMERIARAADARAASLGLDIVDVRLKQTALPEQNLEATFARMRAEREREAANERATGAQLAEEIVAAAERTAVETTSTAERDAQIIRGEADAARTRIFAEAFSADTEFYEFTRHLQAYREALESQGTTMVMTPDSEFFDYLRSNNPGGITLPEAVTSARVPAPLDPPPAVEDDEGVEVQVVPVEPAETN